MAAEIRQVSPATQLDKRPMENGGEGTLNVLIVSTGAERRY
nr:glycerate kinase [uncultured Halomonas sp.]